MKARMTMEARLRQRILRRIANGKKKDDAGVALLSALLFMIIMAGLGIIIVSTVLGQAAPTFLAQKETQTVYAAQAGMQAALGMFRTAVYQIGGVTQYDPSGNGVALGNPALLPCSFSGAVDPSGAADGVGYTVTISYYDADPTGQSAAWLIGPDWLPCTAGSGITPSTAHPLKYALLTSTGTGNALPGTGSTTPGNRSLGAVYEFRVSTVNIAGGMIYDYNDNQAYCLSALSATVGSTVQFLPASQCIAANSALEDWSYGPDYEIKLASTTANSAAGLCISGPPSSTTTGTQNALLATCIASPSVSRWNQLWTWYGSNTWEGSNSTITGLSSWNLGFASASPLTGALLKVYSGTSNGFSPSTEVGAGAAGYGTAEIVNYLEFGRCMDDTNQDVTSTFMISYPCKQDPTSNGVNITWNQKFYYTEPPTGTPTQGPQAIIVNNSGTNRTTGTAVTSLPAANQYCLVTPNYPTTKAVAGALVALVQCSTTTNYQEWTRVYTTSSYGTSYLFTTTTSSGSQLCLEVNPAITYVGWSELDVAPCVASNLGEKWNPPPTYTNSEVGGYREIGG